MMHAAYVIRKHYLSTYTQPMLAAILFTAKSEKIFNNAIILVVLIINLHLLEVAFIFFCLKYCH